MNHSTEYLGLKLENPLIVGAGPFCDSVDSARQLQDAGAAAVVMRSIFEEQIEVELRALAHAIETPAESTPEATSYFPNFSEYQLAPDQYLHQIEGLKKALSIPVIASLNGSRMGGWIDYARKFESAGADAIELNLYQIATRASVAADEVEADLREIVHLVSDSVRIPVAVKISPFHTSPANFVLSLEHAGAAGVVVFNRFYQPDLDLDEMEVLPKLRLSETSELLVRLRWLAIISPQVRCSLAATGGVHSAQDVLKALFAGANAVQIVSALLQNGPRFLSVLLDGMSQWMGEHGYTSVSEFRGAMNLKRCPDPAAFERANYIRILQAWRIATYDEQT
jgi:dihydroorotate dehydrogenase (fumarate)